MKRKIYTVEVNKTMWLENIFEKFRTESSRRNKFIKQYKDHLEKFLKTHQKISFKAVAHPKISIIIPVFNKAYHTLRCLESLQLQDEGSFEVIIFDNNSQDETTALLARCNHIKVISSAENLGFVKAINAAAKMARGKYLLLFNNDATLIAGNLIDACQIFETERNIGAVGAHIKFVTGKAQEAGSIIFNDATTDGFLRRKSLTDLRGLYRREVDYCSGVFLMLQRQQFLEMGGFDEEFAPFYYEETDLAMRLRQQGLRVIYTPQILVEHFEFGSQPSHQARASIATRKPIFEKKWQKTLHEQGHFPPTMSPHLASRRLLKFPALLIIADSLIDAEAYLAVALLSKRHISMYVLSCTQKNKFELRRKIHESVELLQPIKFPFIQGVERILKPYPHQYNVVAAVGKKSGKLLQKTNDLSKTHQCLINPTPEILANHLEKF